MRVLVNFFRREKREEKTKDAARERLLLAVVCDREESRYPGFVKKLKEEIFKTLVCYDEIDKDEMEISLKIEGSAPSLNINVPLRRSL